MASDVQPPHKRARISSRDEDDYLPGNITEIEVTNFMTYTYLKSKPGSRLNLVIGPNGTGKSSLVCAIGIGLAGEPQLLGRAGSIGDYVTRGEEYGIIKISLRGNSPDDIIVITRKIYKQNKSDWLLNGRAATKKDVQDVVRRFNIQVNNLTQFLPQDRVCEFAKMSPIQLLEETEKAVGDPELYEHHVTLKKYSQDLKQHQATVAQLNSTLARGEAENAELEKDVERVQQRNSLFEKAKLMEKKLPWLKYDRLKEMYTAAKEKRKEAKEALDLALEKVAEYKGPFMEIKQVKEKKESACKKLSTDIAHNEKSRREIVELENRLCIQSRAKLKEIEEISKREATRLEKIKKAKQDLEDAEAELANLPPYEIPREALVQLNNEITEREVAVTDCKRQVFEKADTQKRVGAQIDHFVHRIQEIQNVKNRRLRILKDNGVPNIYEAYKWVEDHRPQFKRDVYGPVLLEVNIPNREHAAFVEGHVAFYIWKAFITQDAEDRDLLVRNLKQYDVPIINFTGGTPDGGPAITREMEALGINARLDEVFTAPKVVKNVLIGQFGLNQSFIGSQRSNNKADEISHLGVRDLWTPENHYRWQVSRYGGPMSASVNAVRPPRLLSEGVDAREFTELEQKKAQAEEAFANMENEIKAKKTEQKLWEDQAAEFHKKREEIIRRTKDERKKRQDMLNRIEQRKLKLESIQNEEDSDTAENRLRLVIKRLANERMEKALQMKDLLVEAGNLQIDYSYQRLMVIELEAKLRNLEKEMRAHEAMGIQAQKYFDSCKSSVARYRGDLESAKRAAEEVAQITPELQLSFAEMPGTIEELEFAIDDCVAQARAVLCPNPNVLQDYERRCKQIAELKEKLENANKSLDFCISETERIKIKWLTTLRDLVGRINHTFGRNFREMAVAGEVSLDEHGADFDKYGILIKVKFRENGELQVLSAHHQSGGERSVSTILYLVSLQDLTHCPFRVVDEINQGMDPYNERKMFQQLVRAASQPNTPQCFLLTPKLLPDLDYSESCTVLFIMNGPWIEKPSQVWSSGEPWKLVVESLACQEAT